MGTLNTGAMDPDEEALARYLYAQGVPPVAAGGALYQWRRRRDFPAGPIPQATAPTGDIGLQQPPPSPEEFVGSYVAGPSPVVQGLGSLLNEYYERSTVNEPWRYQAPGLGRLAAAFSSGAQHALANIFGPVWPARK